MTKPRREPHPPVWPFPTYKGEPYRPPRKPRAPKPTRPPAEPAPI